MLMIDTTNLPRYQNLAAWYPGSEDLAFTYTRDPYTEFTTNQERREYLTRTEEYLREKHNSEPYSERLHHWHLITLAQIEMVQAALGILSHPWLIAGDE